MKSFIYHLKLLLIIKIYIIVLIIELKPLLNNDLYARLYNTNFFHKRESRRER